MGDKMRRAGAILTLGWRAFGSGPGRDFKLARSGSPDRARCRAFAPRWEVAVPGKPWRTRLSDRIAGGHLGGSADPHLLYSELTGECGKAEIELEVMPEVGEPYSWEGTSWVPLDVLRRIPDPTGKVLPARTDPDDPDRVIVDWYALSRSEKKRRKMDRREAKRRKAG